MNYTNVYVPSTLDGYGGKLRSGYGEEVVDADYLASGAKTRAYKSPITHSRLIDSGTKDSYFYGDRIIDYNSIKITRNLLLDYSSTYIESLFGVDASYSNTFKVQLSPFLMNVINRTKITTDTMVTAFYYLYKLKKIHPKCRGSNGSGHRLMLAATVLASKYLYDDTFDNTAWSAVSSGIFTLEDVNHMEKELLGFMDFQLYVDSAEWLHFYNGLYLAIHERFAITDLLFA